MDELVIEITDWEPAPEARVCPVDGSLVPADAVLCPVCGTPKSQEQ